MAPFVGRVNGVWIVLGHRGSSRFSAHRRPGQANGVPPTRLAPVVPWV
jgi:hypothetical protein